MRFHSAICGLLLGPEFDAVGAAIAQHATLPLFLIRQAAEHSLTAAVAALESAAAAAASSHSHVEDPEAADIAPEAAANTLQVLLDEGLAPTAGPYLQRQQSAVLSLAQRLVAALPLACGDDGARFLRAAAWLQTACLLACLCGGLRDFCPAPTAEQRQQTAWAVLMCLPRLATALPLILSIPGLSVTAHPFAQLLRPPYAISSISSYEQLQQLLVGADAALRIAVALVPDGDAAEDALIATGQVLLHCSRLANSFATDAAGGQLVEPAELEAAAAAAAQLHADGCCLVHRWTASVGTAGTAQLAVSLGLAKAAVVAQRLLPAAAESGCRSAPPRWAPKK